MDVSCNMQVFYGIQAAHQPPAGEAEINLLKKANHAGT